MREVPAKKILYATKESSKHWFGYDYNINLYRGCNHGCIYCDSRSDCYNIENFSTVHAKKDAVNLLGRDLRHVRKIGVVGIGAMSDPYNPFEAAARITQGALTEILKNGFGVGLATKGDGVARDAGLLREISDSHSAVVKMTITCIDDDLAAKIEPAAPSSSRRFAAVEQVAKAGVFTGVLMMPLLPGINDTAENVLALTDRSAACGARFVYPMFGLTLRQGQREYLYGGLDKHFPGLKGQYRTRFGDQYVAKSPRHDELWQLFRARCRELGLLYKMPDIIRAYKPAEGEDQLQFPL